MIELVPSSISLFAYIHGRCARSNLDGENNGGGRGHFVCKSNSALNKILTDQSRYVAGVEARDSSSAGSFPRGRLLFFIISRVGIMRENIHVNQRLRSSKILFASYFLRWWLASHFLVIVEETSR